jgi:hypothetical protein
MKVADVRSNSARPAETMLVTSRARILMPINTLWLTLKPTHA